MYQCGRCGLTRASGQEMGVIQQCRCPWEFMPPVAQQQQRTWVGLNNDDWIRIYNHADKSAGRAAELAEAILKEKNT